MKLEVEITKAKFFVLLGVGIFVVAGVFVYAQNPSVFGHSADDVGSGTINGDLGVTGDLNANDISILRDGTGQRFELYSKDVDNPSLPCNSLCDTNPGSPPDDSFCLGAYNNGGTAVSCADVGGSVCLCGRLA